VLYLIFAPKSRMCWRVDERAADIVVAIRPSRREARFARVADSAGVAESGTLMATSA